MATYSSILAWRIPWRGAWWVTVHGVVESDLATEQAHAHFLPGTVKEIFLQMDTFIINVNLPCKRVNSTAFRDSPVNVQFE